MSLKNLDNLVTTNQLKQEPPNQNEFNGLVNSAKNKLKDSQVTSLSKESRFTLAAAPVNKY